ncbi:MAG: ferrous iron transport protein B [Bacteroidales bacterium]|nr:ferrous iron transport protein B [Bacteroidales bacterium]
MTIADLKTGDSAKVLSVGGEGALRGHLLDMGIVAGIVVRLEKRAPLGDPLEILIRGYSLSLRHSEAALVEVEMVEAEAPSSVTESDEYVNFGYNLSLHDHNPHPGFGEEGIYHNHEDDGHALPKDATLTFALAGQQNCGKTTLFNALTGANQHVGNFPGVTVDRKDGVIKGRGNTLVTDLPGIYSLSPYTAEEIVSREFIIRQKPNCIINIVDAGNIERNLYLTVQLMELGVPMVLCLNMMDELRGNGGSIRVNEMERVLGLPVVPISAIRGEGVDELVEHAVHVARYQEAPALQDFCDENDHGGAVHRCLHAIMPLIGEEAANAGIPVRFAATKLTEGDPLIENALSLATDKRQAVEEIILAMERERGLDRRAAIADMRFAFIGRLCRHTVVKPALSKEYIRSTKIDEVLTGKWTAIPIFAAVMSLIIWLSIDVLGAPLQDWLDRGIQWLGGLADGGMERWGVNDAIRSLVVDGIFGGVGTVASFVPIIIILFFFLSMLEDSGYMARVAFVTDKILRRIGLTGRSIVPLLIGLGCTVPAVMATRTLPSSRDRKMTILLTPYMSCSAKIPIYAFFSSAFFPGHGGMVLVILYLSAILIGVAIAVAVKLLRKEGGIAPFVMELPNYRMPGARNVGHLLWDKTKDFLQRAFTVIMIAAVVIWILQSFDFGFNLVEPQESMLAAIAGLLSPLFQPLGLGDWRIVTALVTGFMAKESVVATLEVLNVTASMTVLTAIPMLAFCLLYTPCVAAIAAVKRELGWKWALAMVVFQCAVAWIVALMAYRVALLCF